MTRLRLLHLSDLHYHAGAETDTRIVVDALLKDVQSLVADADGGCDALLFSGDLVFSGCSSADFEECYDTLLKQIASAAGVPFDRIFVAPGNHDICREKVRAFGALQEGLVSQLSSTEAVNSFIDQLLEGGNQEKLAIERLEPFTSFVNSKLPHQDFSHPLCSLGHFNVGGKSVGVALLNSAWRAKAKTVTGADFSLVNVRLTMH